MAHHTRGLPCVCFYWKQSAAFFFKKDLVLFLFLISLGVIIIRRGFARFWLASSSVTACVWLAICTFFSFSVDYHLTVVFFFLTDPPFIYFFLFCPRSSFCESLLEFLYFPSSSVFYSSSPFRAPFRSFPFKYYYYYFISFRSFYYDQLLCFSCVWEEFFFPTYFFASPFYFGLSFCVWVSTCSESSVLLMTLFCVFFSLFRFYFFRFDRDGRVGTARDLWDSASA